MVALIKGKIRWWRRKFDRVNSKAQFYRYSCGVTLTVSWVIVLQWRPRRCNGDGCSISGAWIEVKIEG